VFLSPIVAIEFATFAGLTEKVAVSPIVKAVTLAPAVSPIPNPGIGTVVPS